jgi:hypothetical protein
MLPNAASPAFVERERTTQGVIPTTPPHNVMKEEKGT